MVPSPHAALTVAIAPGVSLTLVGGNDGWRFESWSRYDGTLLSPPAEEDRQRRFATPTEAVVFFRALHAAV